MVETEEPRVRAGIPVLVELWRKGDQWQLHLVNYAPEPQGVTVHFGRQVTGRLLSPDEIAGSCSGTGFAGEGFSLTLDLYAVLEYTLET